MEAAAEHPDLLPNFIDEQALLQLFKIGRLSPQGRKWSRRFSLISNVKPLERANLHALPEAVAPQKIARRNKRQHLM
jgi:hypothetical protein